MEITKKDNDCYALHDGLREIASFPDLFTAAVIIRFCKGGRLSKSEYDVAVKTMKEIDCQ